MSKNLVIKAEKRTSFGKNDNSRLRKTDCIPAILYGEGCKENLPLTINAKEFLQTFKYVNLNSTILKLLVDDEKDIEVLVKDYQFDPVRDQILHIDLYKIIRDAEIKTKVPLKLTGVAIGLREGGVVQQHLQEIEVENMKRFTPLEVKLDISNLKVGEKYTVADIKPLENITYITDPQAVVVSVDAS